jgi:hypothetical protein
MEINRKAPGNNASKLDFKVSPGANNYNSLSGGGCGVYGRLNFL